MPSGRFTVSIFRFEGVDQKHRLTFTPTDPKRPAAAWVVFSTDHGRTQEKMALVEDDPVTIEGWGERIDIFVNAEHLVDALSVEHQLESPPASGAWVKRARSGALAV